ncbi:MAG: CoA transferase, partial [Alphaproteobacteria bacterium]|nr:CoA transferase [Alphaproteobacteria bacterium]
TCYDLIAEGYSGIMELTGEPDQPPQKIGTPAADMAAGHDAATAAIAALYARYRTGKGVVIDVSLVNSMTRQLTCRLVPYLGSGEMPQRSGGRDSVIAVYQAFDTSDEPITLGLGTDGIWKRFWEVLGDPLMGTHPQYRTNAQRRAQRAEIVAGIQKALWKKPRDEWLAIFAKARIPAGPIYRLDQVIADAEFQRQHLFYALQDGARVLPQVGTGFAIDGMHNMPRHAPPQLGEHTHEVLRHVINCSDAEIAQLRDEGLI